jgi:hypothetical protein
MSPCLTANADPRKSHMSTITCLVVSNLPLCIEVVLEESVYIFFFDSSLEVT